MRRHLLVFTILLFIFPCLQRVRAEFAYISFEKLVADNPVIVVGKIESKKQDTTNPRYAIGSISVTEVLKNTLDKSNIRVGGKIALSMPSQQRKSVDILYNVGQGGIWILDYREDRFWAGYPDDLQPLSKKQEILSLIESQQNNSDTIVTCNSEFALDLYAKLKRQKGNLFFSPYSISTALAMVYGGARGETEKQMAEVLHFSLPQEKLHPAFGALERSLNAAGEQGNYQLSVANALWGQKGYEFLPEFLSLAEKNYSAGLEEVDFKLQTEKTRKIINDWIEKKTQNKIKELIRPGLLDALTRLVLTNAIYFKGLWEHEFDKEATQDASFVTSSFKKVDVPMMNITENFKYWGDDNLQVLELPYKGKDLSMIVLLPRSVDRLNRLEALLSLEKLNKWLQQLRRRKVIVYLPRFKTTCEFDLAGQLREMGMKDAFSLPGADFSGMTGKKDLFISNILHKAFVEVNEEGTEAAAATAVTMKTVSMPVPPVEPVEFRADRPFVFLIMDNQSGSILFIGRVANPKIEN